LQRRNTTLKVLLFCLLAIAIFPSAANAQLNSNIASVNVNANLATSLSLSAGPGLVNFNLVPNGVANGSATVSITTSWTLQQLIGTVQLWAYFSSAPVALTDGAGDNIPSSSVLGSPDGGAFAPFTGASPFAATSSLRIFRLLIFLFNTTGTRTDTLALRIDTTGLNLVAGTYSGVMHIQAQAM
jgi:hypothetical protein